MLRRALDLIAGVEDTELRRALADLAVDLAHINLGDSKINQAWEESAMPIPSILQRRYEEGRHQEREQAAAAVLRSRFGPDDRVADLARRLAELDTNECFARIAEARSLDDLP